MKILFIPEDKYPPFRVDVSILFGKELNKEHSIDWVMQSERNMKRSAVIEGQNSKYYVCATDNGENIIRRLKKNFYRYVHQIKSLSLFKRKYNVIIIKDQFFVYLIAFIACLIFSYRSKIVFWLSYPFPEADLYDVKSRTARYPIVYFVRGLMLKLLLYKLIVPFSSHIFVQSEKMKDDILECYNHKDKMQGKITSVPMGIEKDVIPFFGYSKVKKTKEFKIIYLGTLIQIRKLDFLVRVLKKLQNDGYKVKLIFIGDGEYPNDREVIIQEAKKYNIMNSIEITGFMSQNDAWDYIRDADVCLSPFYPTPILNSTSPTKIIEYMALGKAVVANNHPEQKKIIEESKCGICVDYSESEFAGAIEAILDDEKEKVEMGINGRKYVLMKRSYSFIAENVNKKLYEIVRQ
jgi:glycosyltransferase involved in cell wall biosynthesis